MDDIREKLAAARRQITALSKTVDEIENLLDGNEKKEKANGPQFPGITIEAIASGDYDRLPKNKQKSREIAHVLLQLWCNQWGKNEKQNKLTQQRMSAYCGAIADGHTPSQFAKAIVGMRCDSWERRVDYCDWQHVRRHMPRWLDMFEELRRGRASKKIARLPFETKKIRGVTVPVDYDWDHFDDRCRDDGFRFDPRARSWVDSDDPAYAELEPFNQV